MHLVDRISKSRANCKNCHWNPHGNEQVQPDNTIYRIVDGGTTDYDGVTPPMSVLKTTRLINFSPDVENEQGTGKPIWRYAKDTNERACNISCHGSEPDDGDMTFSDTLYERGSP